MATIICKCNRLPMRATVLLWSFVLLTGWSMLGQSLPARPQQSTFFFFEDFGEKQGVSRLVEHVIQDQRGYLWCAVQHKGLLRFDGVRFRQYANNPDDPTSLPNNSITDLLLAQDGTLWLSTPTQLLRFDPVAERFSAVHSVINGFLALMQDRRGTIWAATNADGLTYYDPTRDSLITWRSERTTDGYTGQLAPRGRFTHIAQMEEDAAGRLWCSAAHWETGATGLICLDSARKTLVQFESTDFLRKKMPGDQSRAGDGHITIDEKKQQIWVGGWGSGLVGFSLVNFGWEYYALPPAGTKNGNDQHLNDICFRDTDHLWAATNQGIWLFSTTDRRFLPCSEATSAGQVAGSNPTLCVFRDRDGTAWFGTTEGLRRLDPYRQQFAPNRAVAPGFSAQAMAEHPPTNERLWATWTEDGWFWAIAQHSQTGALRQARQRLPFTPHDVAGVHQLFTAPDGRIWVLLNRGIGWLDPTTLRLTVLRQPIANATVGTADLWPRQMTAAPNGDLWIATYAEGVIRYGLADGRFWRPPVLPDLRGAKREFNEFINTIWLDAAGRTFLGTNGTGLEVWAIGGQKRDLFMPVPQNSHSIGGIFVSNLLPDGAENVWVGSENGLCRYRPNAPADSAFERVGGLQEFLWSMVADVQGRIWCTTAKGLHCYDPAQRRWHQFGAAEGMLQKITVQTPLFRDRAGLIWVGDQLHFDPASLVPDPPVAAPTLLGLSVYDQPRPLGLPTLQAEGQQVFPEMRLGPDEEVFSIEIGTLGFTAPEQTQLLFRLRPGDPWQLAGDQRTFTFNRLPGGTYRFEVKSVGADGRDSGQVVVLPLRVVPPFYRAIWFWALCALGFAGAVAAFFNLRYQHRLQQEKTRLRIARDLHDEVGSTLSAISMLSESALRALESDLEKKRLSGIGERARAAMNTMSDIVWSVNPENDSMARVVERLTMFAAETLESAAIVPHFSIGAGVRDLNLPMEQRKEFYLLVKEAVANCARHSRAQRAEIVLEKMPGRLVFQLSDNGVGLKMPLPATPSQGGNGLKNMQTRADALGGRLLIGPAPEGGTVVRLEIPL